MATTDCTTEAHEALKQDRAAFEAATDPQGVQEYRGRRFEMRNCRACKSTLMLALTSVVALAAYVAVLAGVG